jgi:hypothetical protein
MEVDHHHLQLDLEEESSERIKNDGEKEGRRANIKTKTNRIYWNTTVIRFATPLLQVRKCWT